VYSVASGLPSSPLLVAAGKRLLELDRETLNEVRRWDKGVPQFAHHSSRFGKIVLLLSARGSAATLFDLANGSCKRKKVGSCQGLFQVDEERALICSGVEGILTVCHVDTGRLSRLAQPGPFIHAAYARDAGTVLLGLGLPYEEEGSTVTRHRISERLTFVDARDAKCVTVDAVAPFSWLDMTSDGRRVLLGRDQAVRVCIFDGERLTVEAEQELPAPFEPALFVPERGLLVAVDTRAERGVVAAFPLGSPV
jgi:hypothetical protein